MSFTSFGFLFFFPAVICIYYLLQEKYRRWFLLLASYYFYINLEPAYAILLAGITLVTYAFAIFIDKAKTERRRKRLLVLDIIITLLPLFFFKYYNFVDRGIYNLLDAAGIRWPLPEMSFILPVGISFYTFMALGYSIDVYQEQIKPEKNIGIVALFLSFFPIVLSGPIERASNMFPQFRGRFQFDYAKVVKGCQLMLWGYFMKLVIANRIAIFVHFIFRDVAHNSGSSLLLGALLYPIQVYADLGGYSLIAIGAAAMMGIDVMQNFNRPFFATSMSQFWRRWHISLISWLTDYIYTPLSFRFRKYGLLGTVIALMLTFLISGMWHGAAITFIVWGLLQGLFLSVEAVTNRSRRALFKKYHLTKKRWFILASCIFTYLLFAFSELFSGPISSMQKTFFIIKKIFVDFKSPLNFGSPSSIFFTLVGMLILFTHEWQAEHHAGNFPFFDHKSWLVRKLAYAVLIVIILMIGVFDGGQFIYFQF